MRFLTVLALSAGLLCAQPKPDVPAPETPYEAAIIPVKTLTGDAFERLVGMLQVFSVKYRGDSQLRTIIVYAPKPVVEQMRRVVEQLDRPGSEAALGRNAELTITLLRCPPAADGSSTLPAELEGVAKQLRAVTTCKYPTVWDTIPMRLQEGKPSVEDQTIPVAVTAGGHVNVHVRIVLRPEGIYRKDQGRFVRFSQVDIQFRPVTGQQQDWGISTAGDFMEGQKTVLGKVAGVINEDPVFAVIALHVLD